MTLRTTPERLAGDALVDAARELRDRQGSVTRLFRALADFLADDDGKVAWRALREEIPDLTLREVARRSGINAGRLSIIERGVPPTPEEAERIRAAIAAGPTPE